MTSAADVATTLDTLHHVAVQVADVAAAVGWYRTRFHCEVEHQDSTWAFLRFANVGLALVVPHQHPPHVAFASPRAAGFGPLEPHRDGTRSVYISDPDGNTVEVLDETSLPGQR